MGSVQDSLTPKEGHEEAAAFPRGAVVALLVERVVTGAQQKQQLLPLLK